MMDHKADEYWGTVLLAMARDARQDCAAELLFGEAKQAPLFASQPYRDRG
jgi:hypothetical protein